MKRELLYGTVKIIFFIIIFFLSGCDLINPEEPVPAVIKLEMFDLKAGPGQGSDRHKITEVWVYANESFVGVFAPPVEIPFLGDMDQTPFTFHPGIRNNGIADDAIIYPMYSPYEISVNTSLGAFTQVNPETQYKPGVVFSLIADFETTNEFIDNRDTVPASFVTRTMIDPFEGDYSGEIVLSQEADFIEVGNAIALTGLPTNGTPIYLEFQYKCEMEMSVGVLGISLNGDEISNFFYLVRPSGNWNMLYIELTDILQISGFQAYKILFRSLYPPNSTEPELKIQLDNIKVVHL